MDHPTIMEIYKAIGSPIAFIIILSIAGVGWVTVIRLWAKVTDYAKRLGREDEL